MSEADRDLYNCDVDAEPLFRYRPGGFHPVHLGDTFKEGRYRVIHKLGYGGFSTIWLARDDIDNRNVALKISATEGGQGSNEHNILTRVVEVQNTLHTEGHIVRLLDSFHGTGPNGNYLCAVFEPLGTNVGEAASEWYHDGRIPGPVAKSVAKQTLIALDILHRNDIGHGDLHTGNVAFTAPSASSMSESAILELFEEPETALVTRSDNAPVEDCKPRYLVWPVSIDPEELTSNLEIKLLDFGQSFTSLTRPNTLNVPLALRAPEILLKQDIDYRIDLWSMGCMIFELIVGQPPLQSLMATPRDIVRQMIVHFGEPPAHWKEKWESLQDEFKNSRNWYEDSEPMDLQDLLEEWYFKEGKTANFSKEEIRQAGALIKKFLRWRPEERISAAEALEDVWFLDVDKATV